MRAHTFAGKQHNVKAVALLSVGVLVHCLSQHGAEVIEGCKDKSYRERELERERECVRETEREKEKES